jgi:hypothetical protein
MTLHALLALAQCIDASGTARATQVARGSRKSGSRKSGANMAHYDMLAGVTTLRIDHSPFKAQVNFEKSANRHKFLTLVRAHPDVMDTLSRCAAFRAACGAPAPSSDGEVRRLWDVADASFSATSAYGVLCKQAKCATDPPFYSRGLALHAAWRAVWQQLLVVGTPSLAVLMRVYIGMYAQVAELGQDAGVHTVDAKLARASLAERARELANNFPVIAASWASSRYRVCGRTTNT